MYLSEKQKNNAHKHTHTHTHNFARLSEASLSAWDLWWKTKTHCVIHKHTWKEKIDLDVKDMIKFEMLVHAFSSGGEPAPAELSPQFPQVGNFVKLNSFLPFSFSSVCGWPKSANFIKRELVRISCLTEAAAAQTGWNKTITRLVCPALKHASPAYWFFKPLLSGGGGGVAGRWRCIEGHKKALLQSKQTR